MKKLRNSVQLIGRLGQNPKIKDLSNGKSIATFTIATSENYYNGAGEKIEDTQWHNIVAWGKPGEIAAQYLKKGQEVAVEGKLVHRSYETSNGAKRYITEINLNSILMLGGKK